MRVIARVRGEQSRLAPGGVDRRKPAEANLEARERDSRQTEQREKEDKERIEKSLVEMMYRSRSRAHGHATRHGGTGSAGPSSSLGPESEELLALVQASLRKKAASLEEDRWMFEGDNIVR